MPPVFDISIIILLLTILTLLVSLDLMVTNLFWRLSHPSRFRPTQFHNIFGLPPSVLFPPPGKTHRYLDAATQNIDDRYEFVKPLGLGCEGATAIYRDNHNDGRKVVIKSFYRGVRKNPLPSHIADLYPGLRQWPSEIPATLYFANAFPGKKGREGGFIYALDYFWVRERWGGGGWRIVTPFLSFGTLETLAELLRHRRMMPDAVDRVYRRRFRGMLEALEEMHSAGYCHDDVKMDNIFISPNNAFLLGDLGNVREHAHEFHSTHASPPHEEDVERAIRSYLSFLRLSSGEKRWFDQEFHTANAEWSNFYWRYKNAPSRAGELLSSDPFWTTADDHNEECDAFEAEVDKMRHELRQWKSGAIDRPNWIWEQNSDKNNTRPDQDGVLLQELAPKLQILGNSADNGVARQVEGELACVSVSVLGKILPWGPKAGFSQSSY